MGLEVMNVWLTVVLLFSGEPDPRRSPCEKLPQTQRLPHLLEEYHEICTNAGLVMGIANAQAVALLERRLETSATMEQSMG